MESNRLVRDTVLTLIALGIFGSTNFIFNVVVGRFYGSSYLGAVSTALYTSLLLSYTVSTSFPAAVSKYISEYLGRKSEDKANYVLRLALKYGILISSIMTIFAIIFADYICEIFNISKDIFLLSVPIIILYGLYMILKMAYYGYRNVKRYFQNELVADSIFFITLTVVVIFRWKTYVFMPYIFLYTIFIVSSLYFFHKKFKPSDNIEKKDVTKKFFAFAGISFIGTFSSMAMRSLSIIISSAYVPLSDVGFLSAALALTSVFFFFPNAINMVLLPEFSFIYGYGDRKHISNLLNKAIINLAPYIVIINSLGIIFAKFIIEVLYGNKFFPAIFIFQLLLIFISLRMLNSPTISVLSGTKYVHIPNLGSLLRVLFVIPLWLFLVPSTGVLGTALVYGLGIFLNQGIILFFAKKYFNLKINILLKEYSVLVVIFIINQLNMLWYLKMAVYVALLAIYSYFRRKMLIKLLKKM